MKIRVYKERVCQRAGRNPGQYKYATLPSWQTWTPAGYRSGREATADSEAKRVLARRSTSLSGTSHIYIYIYAVVYTSCRTTIWTGNECQFSSCEGGEQGSIQVETVLNSSTWKCRQLLMGVGHQHYGYLILHACSYHTYPSISRVPE